MPDDQEYTEDECPQYSFIDATRKRHRLIIIVAVSVSIICLLGAYPGYHAIKTYRSKHFAHSAQEFLDNGDIRNAYKNAYMAHLLKPQEPEVLRVMGELFAHFDPGKAKEFLEKLEAFVAETALDLSDSIDLECKHFFSGAALYAEERICITLTPVGLAMKLPEATVDGLLRDDKAIPLRYFPEGPIKRGYALFPGGLAEGKKKLQEYVNESVEFVLTLPKPKRKGR